MPKTTEELEAERVAAEEAARVAAEAKAVEDARLVEEEAARLAAEEEANKGKTPEELEAERVAAEEAGKKAKEPSWEEKRIAKLAADKAALAARLAAYEGPDGKPKAPAARGGDNKDPDLVPRSEVQRLAQEEAQAIATRTAFNQQCNDAATEGRKVFPDFDASVKELTKIVDPTDAQARARYDEFLAAALETGEAHKIIYALGRDLDEAERVMNLSPVKRAQELTVLANADEKQVSTLPKPLRPVQGKNAGPSEISPDNPTRADNLSSAEWHKRRQAQVDANAKPFERRARG